MLLNKVIVIVVYTGTGTESGFPQYELMNAIDKFLFVSQQNVTNFRLCMISERLKQQHINDKHFNVHVHEINVIEFYKRHTYVCIVIRSTNIVSRKCESVCII